MRIGSRPRIRARQTGLQRQKEAHGQLHAHGLRALCRTLQACRSNYGQMLAKLTRIVSTQYRGSGFYAGIYRLDRLHKARCIVVRAIGGQVLFRGMQGLQLALLSALWMLAHPPQGNHRPNGHDGDKQFSPLRNTNSNAKEIRWTHDPPALR